MDVLILNRYYYYYYYYYYYPLLANAHVLFAFVIRVVIVTREERR